MADKDITFKVFVDPGSPKGLVAILSAAGLVAMAGDIGGAPLSGNVPAQPHIGAPGETIAQGAAHAAGAGGFHAGAGGGFGHNAHVKTPQGAKLFHEPIGSLIIAHPHSMHVAEHGVESGTHKYVQSGENTFAVHKDADVHVPKDTDVHDENAVKHAAKVIVGKAENGKQVHATITQHSGSGVPPAYEHTPEHAHDLSQNWKKLPAGPSKKPVSVKGAHAGWVPHDWEIYKAKGADEGKLAYKWAKDPNGNWHHVGPNGVEPQLTAEQAHKADSHLASGSLVKESGAAHPPLGAVPHAPKEGAEPAKVSVGGVSVTHDEIKSAIHHLNEAKSTNVKTPLKVKGHPLANMDYMAVSKAELKAHPELKVSPGSKQKHVGQVKLAVLHHLHAQAEALAKTDADHHAAAKGLHDAQAEAEHAQKLTPSVAEFPTDKGEHEPEEAPEGEQVPVSDNVPETHEPETQPEEPEEEAAKAAPVGVLKSPGEPQSWGGVQVTTDQLHEAAKFLEETQNSKAGFKAGMNKLGNPMASADYMGVAKAYKDSHPGAAKGLNTKQLMLAHVNELLSSMDKADEETGHNAAVELHEAVGEAHVPEDWHKTSEGAAVKALQDAAKDEQPHYVTANDDGTHDVGKTPVGNVQFAVGQHDNLNVVLTSDPVTKFPHETYPVPADDVLEAVKGSQILDSPSEVDNGVKSYPPYAEHDAMAGHLDKVPASVVAATIHDSSQAAIAKALWMAHNSGKDKYLVKDGFGKWSLKNVAGEGAYGAPAGDHYHITANLVVVHTYDDGSQFTISGKVASAFLEGIYPAWKHEGEPEKEPGGSIPVWADGKKVGDVPAGSKIYTGASVASPATAVKHVKFPDGSWHEFYADHNGDPVHKVHTPSATFDGDEYVKNGTFKELPEGTTGGKLAITQNGSTFHAKPGTTQWKDKAYPDLGVFLREPDGTILWWPADADHPEGYGDSDATMKEGILDGSLVPHGKEAEEYAKTLGATKNTVPPEPEEAKPEPAAPPAPKDVKVSVSGGKEVSVAASSKVYWYGSQYGEKSASAKYVKHADGSWSLVQVSGATHPENVNYDAYVSSGDFILSGQEYKKAAEAEDWVSKIESAPDLEAPEETGDEDLEILPDEDAVAEALGGGPEATGPPALYYNSQDGTYKVVGEFPAGSKLYTQPVTPDGKGTTYALAPDGLWYYAPSAGGVTTTFDQNYKVDSGSLVPSEPLTAAELEQIGSVQAINEALKTSAVPTPYKTWEQALAGGMSAKVYGNSHSLYVLHKAGGLFTYTKYEPLNQSEYWKVDYSSLTGEHVLATGAKTPLSFDEVKQAITGSAVPNSVLLSGQAYKHGFYYKSDKAKAYLEIKPFTGIYSNDPKAKYIWHDTKGNAKAVTSNYAASFLAEGAGEHYHSAPKPEIAPAPSLQAVTHVTTGDKPGIYHQWDYHSHDLAPNQWQKHADGSVSSIVNGKTEALEGDNAKLWDILQGDGGTAAALVDEHQNSVVTPGIHPGKLVVFGSEHTPEEVKDLLDKIEPLPVTGENIPEDEKWTTIFVDFLGGWAGKALTVKAFVIAKSNGEVTGAAQKASVVGLLRELSQVPQQPSGTVLSGGAEPKFLKGLPPGINTSKDVLSWTGTGYAKPFGGAAIGNPAQLTTPELNDKIKAVSADFGGGKVVGTHVASLSKGEKVQWLDAWKKGDMPAVFALDAKGGKVSTVHPGAPENTATHAITWSPWNPAEVPASKDVEGAWTPSGVVMPQAEADNYIIKAGLKHAEFLSPQEKKQWVIAHRAHDQEKVDGLSKTASDRWGDGGAPLSSVPAWSDNIKAAKSYDAYLDAGNPAASWSSQATEEFIADHKDELAPFVEQFNIESGYSADYKLSYYGRETVVQRWLDAKKAEQEAQQSVPVWTKTPGTVSGGTHEIFELTKTVPLTGAKSQWMFKPAQGGQKFIAEQEHAATQLGNAWGFKTPASQLMEFNGKFGQAQARLDALSDLSYGVSGFYDNAPIPWADFTAKQVSDIASEHVFDWAIDNNDARASNFLVMPDKSVIGIDKGAAWKNFGKWDGLSGDKKADIQSRQVSTALYDAIRAHTISKDVADKAYVSAIQRARKMEKLSDDSMRTILEGAFAHRTDFGAPGSKEALIKASIDRKNKLSSDFDKLWGKVYKDAGWKLPEVPEQKLPLNKQGVQLHSGFSDHDFLEHVAGTKSAGTHAFFGGTELDHSGFLVWKEFEGKGSDKPVVWGESTAVGPAYDKLIAWATENQTANHIGHGVVAKDVEVKGEKAFYDKIVAAGKTISHHSVDKNYNTEKISEFNVAVSALESLQKEAEALIGTANESSPFKGSTPANVADMAKYYQRLAEKVNEAKDKGGTFKPGDLPRWEAPPDPKKPEEAAKLGGIKVELTAPYRPGAHVTNINGYASQLAEDHQLHVDPSKAATGESSNVWKVTLPTGEEIEFSNGNQHGVAKAFHGRLRFRSHAGDASSMERIKGALQMMGLNMKEAEEHDLELHYWRHLGLTLADRKDGRDPSSKYAKVWDTLKSGMGGHGLSFKTGADNLEKNIFALEDAGLSPEHELAVWRSAWATVTSKDQVDKFIGANAHLPHLHRQDITAQDTHGGVPFWYRFDMDQKFLAGRKLPAHHFYAQNKAEATAGVVHGGGLLSAEERLRYLGMWLDSSYGNPASYGATKYVFMRLNQEGWSDADLYMNPKVLARTTNYAFSDDEWGNVDSKAHQAYFDPAKSTAWSGGANETMADATVSLLDDIEILKAKNETQRTSILSYLKSIGITEIRGVPIEQRIVTHISAADLKKIHDAYASNPDMLDTMADVGGGATAPVPLSAGNDVVVLSVPVVEEESVFA